MATLISALASGVRSAAGGTAEIYTRGTGVLSALVYADSAGTARATTTTLGSDGEAIRYVGEAVDVVVKDSTGATVRQFTELTSIATVGVESPAFTGVFPDGSTGAGGYTTLANALALYAETFGDQDGLVSLNGVPTLLRAALASTAGVYFNAKRGYGAAGDGTADDAGPLQNAITAASTGAAGVVYLETGVYLVGSPVTTGTVSFLGAHGLFSDMRASATGAGLAITGNKTSVSRCGFTTPSGAVTSAPLTVSGTWNLVDDCNFGSVGGPMVSLGGSLTRFRDCRFAIGGTGARFVAVAGVLGSFATAIFEGCYFDFATTVPSAAVFGVGRMVFVGCTFALTATSGGATLFPSDANGSYTLIGCRIICSNTAGTNTVIGALGVLTLIGCEITIAAGTTVLTGGATLREAGCSIPDGVTMAAGLTAAGSMSQAYATRVKTTTGVTTSYTPALEQPTHELQLTNAALAFGAPTGAATGGPAGQRLTIIVKNASGGSVTPTWDAVYKNVPATAIPNTSIGTYVFAVPRASTIPNYHTNAFVLISGPVITAYP